MSTVGAWMFESEQPVSRLLDLCLLSAPRKHMDTNTGQSLVGYVISCRFLIWRWITSDRWKDRGRLYRSSWPVTL